MRPRLPEETGEEETEDQTMLHELASRLGGILGVGAESLTLGQMTLRAVLVYGVAIALVRLGEKRFLGKFTALDVILGFVLGSILSRAITGNSPFFETLAAGTTLVVLHWLFAVLAFHSDWFGALVKGQTRKLVEHGEIQWDAMQRSHISKEDLLGALRASGRVNDPAEVAVAYLERSGEISVIKADKGPQVIEVQVEAGVQTVRIEWR